MEDANQYWVLCNLMSYFMPKKVISNVLFEDL